MMIAIYDIDGCCVDSSFRNEHMDVDFQAYLDLHHTDQPIEQGILLYSMLMQLPHLRNVFITGRGEEQRTTTVQLLGELFPDAEFEVLMRPAGDRRPDLEIKKELMDKAGIDPADVFIAFDDRPGIIAMYRSMGIVAYQTAEGY